MATTLAFSATSHGRTDVFDATFDKDDQFKLTVAPRARGVGEGCVVMTFDPDLRYDDDAIELKSLVFSANCNRSRDLVRRWGTRRMLIGAMMVARELAKSFPHLVRFKLQDESMFNCPEPKAKVRTIISDLFLAREP
jgi:hypothetical protein